MIILISFKELLLSAISLQSPFNELYNIDKYIIKNIQKPLIAIPLRYFFVFKVYFVLRIEPRTFCMLSRILPLSYSFTSSTYDSFFKNLHIPLAFI